MTIINKIVSVTAVSAVLLASLVAFLPGDASAIHTNQPLCVLNTIVQPFNNGGTTLSWKVTNAHTISINNGVGTVNDADSIVVYPTTATNYTLTATGSGGTTTCSATVQPTSAHFNNGVFGTPHVNSNTCSLTASPDLVVPGGTAVLSWSVGSAFRVTIDGGIGTVGNSGTRVVPYSPTPRTYTLVAENSNGTFRSCSATVNPVGTVLPTFTSGVNIPGAFIAQTPGVVLPAGSPHIQATYTQPTPQYVSIAQVPYTGPNDVAYVLTLLAVLFGALGIMYTQRATIAHALASFSPVDNDDFESAVEEAVITEKA